MNTVSLYSEASLLCSKNVTEKYSTSFSTAVKILHPDVRDPIFSVYAFVRLSDEIVDTFHEFPKQELLDEFKTDTYMAIKRGISLNPVLQSFQKTVNAFQIDHDLIEAFFKSMEMDLKKTDYHTAEYHEYIYGSAEVVGLICLKIFCQDHPEIYQGLKSSARALGAAFQKVNFLRDLKDDQENLDRNYFPGLNMSKFDLTCKRTIEKEISLNFKEAIVGIRALPPKARFGVYLAYRYYYSLFNKIRDLQPVAILNSRVRIPNSHKFALMLKAGLRNKLNLI